MKSPLMKCFVLLLFIGNSFTAAAQSDLFRVIKTQDSLMFEVTFNTCDLRPLDNLVSENFEFYHDKGGVTMGKSAFVNSIKNNICSHQDSFRSRRELVKGSMEVYPLEKNGVLYGAIQSGRHRFFETFKGKPEQFGSIARFTHLWLLEEGKWKFVRGLSYDHLTVDTPESEPMLFENDAAVEKWMADNHLPALGLGIIREGHLKEVKVYGMLKKGQSAPYNALFNVASLTKPVVAMLTLRLVSQGKWNLDEPLAHFWVDPDLKNDPRHHKLTTRHVLTHQTGFANWRWNNPDKKLAFGADPGTKYGYSGEGFEYLRKALENKFKKPLEVLAKEIILTSVGMTDSEFYWTSTTPEARFAVGHNTKGKPYKIHKNTSANAADDLLTTVEDYGKFMVSVANAEGLTEAVFNEMVSHQVKTKENQYFGLGWEIFDLGKGEYVLSHGGADEGVKTQVFLLPKSKQGIVIFTTVDDGYKVYLPLLKTYLGDFGQRIFDIATK